VVTTDYSGDGLSTTVCLANDGRLEPLEERAKPDSLGIYYSAVTQFLGFQKDSDEYKVMGMAGYGSDEYDLSQILEVTDSGYRLNSGFLRGVDADVPAPSKQERLFDEFPLPVEPRVPGSPIEQVHYDVACSAQRQLERACVQLVRYYVEKTGARDVCLAGGVALNCLMNQAVRESDFVSSLYVPPVSTDAGLAFGAACLHAAQSGEMVAPLEHAYWGPGFGNGAIREVLDRAGVAYRESGDAVAAAAERIGRGQCVGWFQGRMEYGPRALGSRSILADPGIAAMKDVINDTIKFRESFRPLAPAVRHQDGPDYFRNYARSPYMTQTFDVEDSTRERIPAVVHVDGTSRLQSVDAHANEPYYRLLGEVERHTGTPVVLNTSLNALDDPIACTPVHALRTYFSTGLDSLVIGDFVLDKK
jgi:carbamoyltransferase